MPKIITQNVRGLNDITKRKSLFYYLRGKAEIVCLQETHCELSKQNEWELQWGSDKCFWSHFSSAARGVAILVKKESNITILGQFKDDEGRMVGVNYEENGEKFVLVNLYAPNTDDPKFFTNVFRKMEDFDGHRIIVGDFNLVLDVSIDRTTGSESNNEKAADIVKEYMEETQLCDIWRSRNENVKTYTYMRKTAGRKKSFLGSRLDLVLVEIGIASWILDTKIHAKYKTDHCAVSIDLTTGSKRKVKSHWKLNNRVVYEKDYVERINNKITETLDCLSQGNPQDVWEATKISVIAESQEYCRERAQNRVMIISQLEEQVEKYQTQFPLAEQDTNIYDRTVQDLETFKDEHIQGVIFRSQAKWYNEGEKNTKYFYNLEKSRSNAKGMDAILQENGEIERNPDKILNMQSKFYQKLYTAQETSKFDFTNSQKLVIPEEINEEMKGEMTIDEIRKAIKSMNRNRAPGLDGLTVEFYIVFFAKIENCLLKAINQAFSQTGSLHYSAMRGLISLIPKKDKDTRIIENLRPITLLNIDYKIVEKVLAERIKPALNHIIDNDQKGFLSERRISSNIRRVMDLIEIAEKEDFPALIVSIDFQKCFDRIEFSAIFESLAYFQFHEDFIRWMKIIYNNPVACLVNQGKMSKFINLERGVRQGGPCSAYYFLVVAEILAIELRKDQTLKGIMINELKKLLGQYADDIDLYLWGTQRNLQKAINVINHFANRTGFKMNHNKTTIYRIGSLKNSNAIFYTKKEVAWTSDYINVLGVNVNTQGNSQTINYNKLLTKTEAILSQWNRRNLSLHGKVQVVNTLIGSLFVYKMTVLRIMDTTIILKLNKLVTDFLWNSRRAKISLDILQNLKQNGGLGLVNFQIKDWALKIAWLQIMLNGQMINECAHKILDSGIKNDIWRCNINEKDIKKLFKDSFWRDILIIWAKYNFHKPENQTEIKNQTIWYNSWIRINKKPCFFKKPYQDSLMYVTQLFDQEGKIISYQNFKSFFNITQMEWNGIVTAIPTQWKKELRGGIGPETCESAYEKILRQEKPVKFFYHEMLKLRTNLKFVYLKWKNDTLFEASFDDFAMAFSDLRIHTNQSKLRSFQFRLLHRALILNNRLVKWGMSNSEKCTFCKKETETIIHLFWNCEEAQKLWSIAKEVCQVITKKEKINVNYTNLMSGNIVEVKNHIFNFVFLVAKQYLYAKRCQKNNVNKHEFIAQIEKYKRYEKYQAIKEGKMHKHIKKWLIQDDAKIEYNGTDVEDEYVHIFLNEINL